MPPIRCGLLLALLFLLPTATTGSSIPDNLGPTEEHDPIRIEGNVDLLGPDVLTNNGVRGGTGLPEDPFVISDWTISVREGEAVFIQDVTSHLVLENLVIRGSGQGPSFGFWIQGSQNIEVRNVTVTGGGSGFVFLDSRATLHDIVIQDLEAPDVYWNGLFGAGSLGIMVDSSALSIHGFHAERAHAGLFAWDSSVTVQDATTVDIANPFHLQQFGSLRISDASLRYDQCDGKQRSGGNLALENGVGVSSDPASWSGKTSVHLERMEISCFLGGVSMRMADPDYTGGHGGPVTLEMQDVTIRNHKTGVEISAPGARADLEGLDIVGGETGVDVHRTVWHVPTNVVVKDSLLGGNDIGILASHRWIHPQHEGVDQSDIPMDRPQESRLIVQDSDLVANGRALVHEPPEHGEVVHPVDAAHNYWGPGGPSRSGSNRIVGDVNTDPVATAPHDPAAANLEGAPEHGVPSVSFPLLLAALAALVLVGRQRRGPH